MLVSFMRYLVDSCTHTSIFFTHKTTPAYYHPSLNEIVFPAAILQSPFFNKDVDDAVNFGAMGAVIGHEM